MKRYWHALPLLLGLAACGASGSSYERGMAAFEKGDVRTARVEFLNVLQADPADKAARIMQARVQLALGDGIGAEAELQRARSLGIAAAATDHLLAHARLLQGDAEGALALAAGVPIQHRAYAASISGQAFSALGNPNGARVAFTEALRLAPRDPRIWTEVAAFRRSTGDIEGALQAADRALAARPDHVPALLLRGELTRGQYGLVAALPWFDRAIALDPGHVNARLERAITYGDLGRMSDMLAEVREVHGLTGGHPMAYYLQSVLAARARRFELARSLYDRTRGAYDDAPAGMLLHSAIDFETGNAQLAAQRLERLVQLQPGNRKARRLLAAARWRLGDFPGVVDVLAAIADRPDADAYSLSLTGRALQRLGDRDAASFYLARAARPQPGALVSLDPLSDAEYDALRAEADARPDDGPTQVRFVSALLARGRGPEALERARRIQSANPGAPEAHMLAGDALGVQGDFAAAAEQYRRAANLAFTEAVALRLIEALQRSGQTEAAAQVLGLFVRQNPRNVAAQVLVAGRAMQAQDWESAVAVYESLRSRIGDNDATILNNLAWAYSELEDYESALPLARRAWALDRDNPATTDTLGWILFKSGEDRMNGLALLERAARGAPTDAAIRQRLERARRG